MNFKVLLLFLIVFLFGFIIIEQQINSKNSLKVNIYTTTDVVCHEDSICMTAEAKNGSGNYKYYWYNSVDCSNYYTQNITIYPMFSSWYYVEVFDSNLLVSEMDSIYIEIRNN